MAINYSTNNHIATLSWNLTSLPMNVLNDESITAFEAALEKAYSDTDVKGIIITSEKPEFVAGADLKMLLKKPKSSKIRNDEGFDGTESFVEKKPTANLLWQPLMARH